MRYKRLVNFRHLIWRLSVTRAFRRERTVFFELWLHLFFILSFKIYCLLKLWVLSSWLIPKLRIDLSVSKYVYWSFPCHHLSILAFVTPLRASTHWNSKLVPIIRTRSHPRLFLSISICHYCSISLSIVGRWKCRLLELRIKSHLLELLNLYFDNFCGFIVLTFNGKLLPFF